MSPLMPALKRSLIVWAAAKIIEVMTSATLLVLWSRATNYPNKWSGFTPSISTAFLYTTFFEIVSGYAITTLICTIFLYHRKYLLLLIAILILFVLHYVTFSFLMGFAF